MPSTLRCLWAFLVACVGLANGLFAEDREVWLAQGGQVVEYQLEIRETTVEHAGQRGVLLTVNGQSPAPTLRFHEGDWARITVHNGLEEDE
ncbi:MAG TPA: multicopper oxidase domain-containing protein, partial [Planctomycetota bacterium]|nr:multicopper oxidase domain-containing protein [Planctomycetota bacterium]